jgi:hypothetical protein
VDSASGNEAASQPALGPIGCEGEGGGSLRGISPRQGLLERWQRHAQAHAVGFIDRRWSSWTTATSRLPRPWAAIAGGEEFGPGQGFGTGVRVQRGGVALGVVPVAGVQARFDGVAVEPQDPREEPGAMADRGHTQPDQVLGREFRQDVGINVVAAEGLGVAAQAEAPQPGREVHLRHPRIRAPGREFRARRPREEPRGVFGKALAAMERWSARGGRIPWMWRSCAISGPILLGV